jgi:hypothetical protein
MCNSDHWSIQVVLMLRKEQSDDFIALVIDKITNLHKIYEDFWRFDLVDKIQWVVLTACINKSLFID